MSLLQLQEPAEQTSKPPIFFSIGFRPFFAVSSLVGAALMILWVFAYRGQYQLPQAEIFSWHAHEMIYAYAIGIIAGFLLTAVRNWTGLETAQGPLLMGLVVLWFLPRPLMLWLEPSLLLSLLDLAFIPCLIIAIATPIIKSRNWRNLIFAPILMAFFACNVLYHLAIHKQINLYPSQAMLFALELVLMMITIIGARVMPMFTRNGTQGAVQAKTFAIQPWLLLGIGISQLILSRLIDSAIIQATVASIFALVILHAWIGWQGRALWNKPILWVLHIGYLGLACTYFAKAASALSMLPVSFWIHCAAVMCIGLMTIGFIGRVSLGHSGRALNGSRLMLSSYILMILAAILRLSASLYPNPALWDAAALCWSGALLCFAIEFIPYLSRPRADAKPS